MACDGTSEVLKIIWSQSWGNFDIRSQMSGNNSCNTSVPDFCHKSPCIKMCTQMTPHLTSPPVTPLVSPVSDVGTRMYPRPPCCPLTLSPLPVSFPKLLPLSLDSLDSGPGSPLCPTLALAAATTRLDCRKCSLLCLAS